VVCNLYDMSLEGVQVDIRPEWSVLEQIPLTSLSKLSYDVGEPEDITTCGTLDYYDKACDRVTPKTERVLERFENRQFYKVTTTDDPVIRYIINAVLNHNPSFASLPIVFVCMSLYQFHFAC
jgi:hypothetical protein